ncbi:MAG: DNA translocase FtsK 4TM domain-containing protein, partial [Actinobacteria bacterium]|nr:DNA translocase FtsK 4TM domain-containing protein [Actinomycetota bacterium]
MRDSLATHLGRQSDDVWGLLVLALGVVAALGIYADLTGPVGHVIRDLAGLLFGWGRLALPFVIAGIGLALLQGRPRQEPGRVAIGATFLLVAATGLLHLFRGSPRWTDPAVQLRDAGGLIGALIGEPLRSLLATPGSALILSVVALVGLLILLKMSARDAWNHIVNGFARILNALSGSARALSAATTTDVDERIDATRRHPASAPTITTNGEELNDADAPPDEEPEREITVTVAENPEPTQA